MSDQRVLRCMGSLKQLIKDRRNYHGKYKDYYTAELEGNYREEFETLEFGTAALEQLHTLLRMHNGSLSTPPSSSGISPLTTP